MGVKISAQNLSGIFNSFGYGKVGQSFSYGKLSMKYTGSNRAEVTNENQSSYLDKLSQFVWNKWGDAFKSHYARPEHNFADQISKNFTYAPGFVDRGSSKINYNPTDIRESGDIGMRMSAFLQSGNSTELASRDGTASA